MFEKKLSNKPSSLLSDAQNIRLFSMLRKKSVSLTTTVARLYNKHGNEWVLLHTVTGPGVVCFERDANTKSYYLRFYNLEQKSLAYEQQIQSEGIWISRDSNTFFRLTANNRRIIVGFEFSDAPAALEEMEELALALQGKHNKLKKAAAARAAEERKLGGRHFHVKSFFHKRGKYAVTPKAKENSCTESSSTSGSAVSKSESASQSKGKETIQKSANSKSESSSQSKGKETIQKSANSKSESASQSKGKETIQKSANLKSESSSQSKGKETSKIPTDSRPSSAKEANKSSSAANRNEMLENDPTMAYLFNQMGCDYAKIMKHREARKKVENFLAKYGGLNVFKKVVKQNGITEEVLLVQPSKSNSPARSEQQQFSAAAAPVPTGLIRIPPPPRKHVHWEVHDDMRVDKSPKGSPPQLSPQTVPKEGSQHQLEESAENPFLAELEDTIVNIERTAAESAGEVGRDTGGSSESAESQWSDEWDDDEITLTQESSTSEEGESRVQGRQVQ